MSSDAFGRNENRPKKRINGISTQSQEEKAVQDTLTAEEFILVLTSRGFPLSELDNWNTGMLINWVYEYDRQQKKANGIQTHDDYQRYQVLKQIQPQVEEDYKNGIIDKEKYESFIKTIETIEKAMG